VQEKERRPLPHLDAKLLAKKGASEEPWRGSSTPTGSSSGGGGSPVRLGPEAREGGPVTRIRDWVSFAREREEGTEG
jgi:hypothetical protein